MIGKIFFENTKSIPCVKESYINWINELDWTFFTTLTTKYELTQKSARRAVERFHRHLKEISDNQCKIFFVTEKYEVKGEDIIYDDNKKLIYSQNTTIITDPNQNKITVNMFNYLTLKKMFFSKGDIEVLDNRKNKYLFSEIYIDEVKNKIVGSDIKSYFNENSFKEDERNNPRFFANSATITKENTIFEKGVFTSCKIRENDKCPPWVIRAKTIEHNAAKKTIYYEDAVMKIYDFPVFYFHHREYYFHLVHFQRILNLMQCLCLFQLHQFVNFYLMKINLNK